MSKVKDLYQYLNTIAPFSFQEKYDNAGLIVGDLENDIEGVLVCLDSTPEIIDEAIATNCNVVVAHHPIVFSGLKSITGKNYIERCIIKAIKNDISIIAIHTNLDNVLSNGVNAKIAEKLSLKNIQILKPIDGKSFGNEEIGAGLIGELNTEIQPDEFTKYLKDKMDLNILKRTQYLNSSIKKVAICGGSGSFLLEDAIVANADAFITADFKYHQFFDADGKLVIYDIGHYESEKYTIDLLKDLITNNFSNFAVRCTKNDTNPVFYN